MQMTRQNFNDIVYVRGLMSVIMHRWNQRETIGRTIFNVKDSTQAREQTTTVGGISTMDEKPEGAAINYVSLNQGFDQTFTPLTYAAGFRVTHEAMMDELYGTFEKLGKELANSAMATEETLMANIFNNGFDSSFTGPDGLELFSTAHLRENGGTYANEGTAAVLSATSLESNLISYRDWRDGGGKRMQIRPRYLLTPANSQFIAAKIINSTANPTPGDGIYNAGSYSAQTFGDSAVNPINGLGLKQIVWDYLTGTDDWFLLPEKEDHELLLFEREPFTTDYIYDFDTGDYKIKGGFRQSSGWADPRGVWGNAGS